MKNILQHPEFQKWFGRAVLLLLLVLMVLKWIFGWCSLWFCGLFLTSVIAWAVISDFGSGMKDQ